MPILVTCKSDEDRIKTEGVSVGTLFSANFHHSRASNSKANGLFWPKIELVRDFMPVLVTSKFDEDLIKNERASFQL